MPSTKQRILGWYAFDWASQPYHTLILTFIFGPYFVKVVGDPVAAQTLWAQALTVAGVATALLAPVLGALGDQSGHLVRWVGWLSAVYVTASAALWLAVPGTAHVLPVLMAFGAGLVATELAIVVTNAFLPGLAPREETGRLSGTGYAIGYAGGLIALVLMLLFFAEGENGRTLLGLAPPFGLDPAAFEGTRVVGPFCALWFAVSMIPFFAWVKDPVRDAPDLALAEAARRAARDIRRMWGRALGRRSLVAFLLSSMFYRDALVGLYGFGGLYAKGVLGWSVREIGVFGILGVVTAMLACWAGGKLETGRGGPRRVIAIAIAALVAVSSVLVGLTRDSLFGIALPPGSALPDALFFVAGGVIGAAGGILQSASRSMMVRHADPAHPGEAFGLYALTGKATAFLAPFLIGMATLATDDQRMGLFPLIFLFLMGLCLLVWVKRDGDI
ncbi:MFS transporter [Mangrovicoccus algicola]|uniref:MFS transporter n=1 Tax=Mangrovicoccus algicola TaxID=2771008 RepID=A0A8J7CYX6_9RHOB|nr:MFS transporter [Mangrovicoccus algicola]MBE3640122.1 MFS transporter [Mangrovicoccus algicola]